MTTADWKEVGYVGVFGAGILIGMVLLLAILVFLRLGGENDSRLRFIADALAAIGALALQFVTEEAVVAHAEAETGL